MKRAGIVFLALMCLLLASCGCSHKLWANATCEQPKTCVQCGTTEGAPAGHIWSPATLEAPKTCTICEKTEGVSMLEELYPLNRVRSDATKFFFDADDFPALLNRELKGTGYTVQMTSNTGSDAYYDLVREGETSASITCHISFVGEQTAGISMYMFVVFETDASTTQEEKDLHGDIISAVIRTVHIPNQGMTYEKLIERAQKTPDGGMYYGALSHVNYTIFLEEDSTRLMIILGM